MTMANPTSAQTAAEIISTQFETTQTPHTAGPWWVEKRSEWQVQAKHRGEGSSYCVATVNHWEFPEANACLIAAAPVLLGELTRIYDWLVKIENCDFNDVVADGGITVGMVVQQEAREQARRALDVIAKATGAA